jgi:hypothetical protein
MTENRKWWGSWARFLQRSEMERPAAYLLEAAGPLTILLAQAMILGQPFLSDPLKRERWAALAEMLENPAEAKAFASFLKEEQTS